MNFITPSSEEIKDIGVTLNSMGESILIVPSLYKMLTINLSKPLEELKREAKELFSLGIINHVHTPSGLEDYIFKLLKLKVIIQELDFEPGDNLLIKTSIRLSTSRKPQRNKQLQLNFNLSWGSEELPLLLPKLIETLTGLLILFNHRLVDSSICLN